MTACHAEHPCKHKHLHFAWLLVFAQPAAAAQAPTPSRHHPTRTLDGKIGHGHVHRTAVSKVNLAGTLGHGLDAIKLDHRHHGRLTPAMQLPCVAGAF